MGSPSERVSIEKRRDLRTEPRVSDIYGLGGVADPGREAMKTKDKRKTKRRWFLRMSEGKKGRAVSQCCED